LALGHTVSKILEFEDQTIWAVDKREK